MANAIKLLASLTGSNGAISAASGQINASLTSAGTELCGGISQTIPTAATEVNTGSIAGNPSVIMIRNMDAANAVDVSPENTAAVTPDTIPPGGVIIRSPSARLYAKAHTASVQIYVWAAE